MYFGAEAVPPILKALSATGKRNAGARFGAVRVISEWHGDRYGNAPEVPRPPELAAAVPLLAKMLRVCDNYYGCRVIEAIRGFGTEAKPAVRALRARAARADKSFAESAQAALVVLKELGEAVDVIADARRRLSDPDPEVRDNAVYQLAGRSDLTDVEKSELYTLVLNDDVASVRARAVGQAAWDWREDTAALMGLLRTAAADPATEVRAAAAHRLANPNIRTAGELPLLLTLIGDADPDVRRLAIEALAERGAGVPEVVATFREALADPDPGVFREAVSALGKFNALGNTDTLAAVWPRLSGLSDYERLWPLRTIEDLDALPTGADAVLLELLPACRNESAGAVIRLLRKVQNPSAAVGRAMRELLASIDPTAYNAVWLELEPRRTLAAIGELTATDIPPLARLLASDNTQEHEGALELLRPLGAATVPFVRAQLPNTDGWRRASLLKFLAQLGPAAAEAVPDVLNELNSTDADALLGALLAVHAFGPTALPAVPRVLDLLAHEDARVRSYARSALIGLGAAVVPHLARLVKWWRSDDCPDANDFVDVFVALAPHAPDVLPILRELVRAYESRWLEKVLDALIANDPRAAEVVPDLLARARREQT